MLAPFLTSSTWFPVKLIEGEHFVLADLCMSSPGSSFRAAASQEDPAEAATGALVRYVRITQPQSLRLFPRPEKMNEIGRGPRKLK